MSGPTLTSAERAILVQVLAPFREKIDRAIVFGSRAKGTNSAVSDIDLALCGDLTQADIWKLSTMFDESSLAVRVDVIDYGQVVGTALGRHIDAVGQAFSLTA